MKAKEIAETIIKNNAVYTWSDKTMQLAQAYLDLLKQQEGKVLVPLEPTEKMIHNFVDVWFKGKWPRWSADPIPDKERFHESYKAMIQENK